MYFTVLLLLHFNQYFLNIFENDIGCFVFCVSGGMTVGKTSKQHGIPKMTLSDKIDNKWKTNKVGRAAELTKVEEKILKFCIDYMASINHPLTITLFKAFAWSSQRLNRFNSSVGPGNTWCLKFKK